MRKVQLILAALLIGAGIVGMGCKSPTDSAKPATPISNPRNIPVPAPVLDAAPVMSFDAEQYTGSVAWSVDGTAFDGDAFAAATPYTATITLRAKDGFTFAGVTANWFRVRNAANNSNISTTHAAGFDTTLSVDVTFPATGNVEGNSDIITITAIAGITPPVIGGIPVTRNESSQYIGTVTWSVGGTVFDGDTFAASTVYTAIITLEAIEGFTLEGIEADFFTVAGADPVNNVANSPIITAVFPATAAQINAPQTIPVPAPVTGAAPVRTFDAGAQYLGTVAWSVDGTAFDGDAFAAATTYTAMITLMAKTGFTFTGVTANWFRVQNASGADITVTHAAGIGAILSATVPFPVTAAQIDSPQTIPVPAPVTGIAPVRTFDAGTQYSGTVAWSTGGIAFDGNAFAATTLYTATITLTAKSGYTFAGVIADWFRVQNASGATITTIHSAGSGATLAAAVTFPATAAQITSPQTIPVPAPVTGAAPVTAFDAGAQYSGTAAWSVGGTAFTGSAFAASTTYTATITLTAKSGFTFTGVTAGWFRVQNASGGAITTIHAAGSGTTLTATVAFPGTTAPLPGPVWPVLFENGQWATEMGTVTPAVSGNNSSGTNTSAADSVFGIVGNNIVIETNNDSNYGPPSTGRTFTFTAGANIDISSGNYEWLVIAYAIAPGNVGWIGAGIRSGTTTVSYWGAPLTHTVTTIRVPLASPSSNGGNGNGTYNAAQFRGFSVHPTYGGNTDRVTTISKVYLEAGEALPAPTQISNPRNIPVSAPVTGAAPVQTFDADQYTGTVVWRVGGANFTGTAFAADTAYTATITLAAKTGFTFTGVTENWFRVQNGSGGDITTTHTAGSGATLVVTVPFPATAAQINNPRNIPVSAPVTGATPVRDFDAAQYTGTVAWSSGGTAFTGNAFAAATLYTATITLTAKAGFTFTGVAANWFRVLNVSGGNIDTTHAAGSGTTLAAAVTFPATAAQINAPQTIPVPAPVTGAAPVRTFDAGAQYQGTVEWRTGSASGAVFSGTAFAASTAYHATMTLTAKAGYTFTGVTANWFRVQNVSGGAITTAHTAGSGATLTATVTFPGTAAPQPRPVWPVLFENGQWATEMGTVALPQLTSGATGTTAIENGKLVVRTTGNSTSARNFIFDATANINANALGTYTHLVVEFEETMQAVGSWIGGGIRIGTASVMWWGEAQGYLGALYNDGIMRMEFGRHDSGTYSAASLNTFRGFVIQPNYSDGVARTVTVTKVYLEAAQSLPTPAQINNPRNIPVTAPVTGAVPVRTFDAGAQYQGTVEWRTGSASGAVFSGTAFAASTAYHATITLTAKTGFTFTGVTANWFRVQNASGGNIDTTHTAGSGTTLSAAVLFPATGAVVTPPVGTANHPFPQSANSNYAIQRVMPPASGTNARSQSQMNQDTIDQFAKIIPEFLVDYETARNDTMNDPNTFRMILSMFGGTGPEIQGVAVTTTETMGYGMMILGYMAGCESAVVSSGIRDVNNRDIGGRTIGSLLKDALPTSLRNAYGARDVTVRDYFDGMFRSLNQFPTNGGGSNLMSWTLLSGTNTNGSDRTRPLSHPLRRPSGASTATDGDLDMAYAMLLAAKQWGPNAGIGGTVATNDRNNYGRRATLMIGDIFQNDVDRGQNNPARYYLRIGNWTGTGASAAKTRPSDFMLQHLRSYAAADTTQIGGVNRWELVINTTQIGMEQMYAMNNPRTGVLPDFIRVERGATGTPLSAMIWHRAEPNYHESANDGNHWYNSCRVPWRLGLDALHHNDKAAVKTLHDNGLRHLYNTLRATSTTWSGISAVQFNGTRLNSSGINFAAPTMVAAAVYGTSTDMGNAWNFSRTQSGTSGRGYGAYFNLLSMIAASGNWWAPEKMP
ncbi:MAG: hypothetical protein FWD36_05180 [Treponema sp.]|nr:hypothetical protein [Treponema sp.]